MKIKIIVLVIFTLFAKSIAFFKEMALAYAYGTSEISDAFVMATSIPIMIYSMLSAGISSGFIPIYGGIKQKDNKEARYFARAVYGALIALGVIISVICFFSSEGITLILAKGFSEIAINNTVLFLRICAVAVIFNTITCFFLALCQAEDQTSITGVISIPLNLMVMGGVFLSYKTCNIYFLPIGYSVGCFLQFLLSKFVALKRIKDLAPCFNLKNEHIILLVKNSGILLLGASLTQVNLMVDKMLASSTFIGGVTTLEYANRVIDLIMGIVILSISTVVFPRLVSCSEDIIKFKQIFSEGFEWIVIIIVPIVIYVLVFSEYIVKIIYYRGAFNEDDLINTSAVFRGYAIGLIPYGLRELFTKVFYAKKNVQIPVINSTISIVINIILNFVFIYVWGLKGLAYASSLAALISVLLLSAQLKKASILCFYGYKIKMLIFIFLCFINIIILKYLENIVKVNNIIFVGMTILYFVFVSIEAYYIILRKNSNDYNS